MEKMNMETHHIQHGDVSITLFSHQISGEGSYMVNLKQI